MNGPKSTRNKRTNNELKKKDQKDDEMEGQDLGGMNEKNSKQKAEEDTNKDKDKAKQEDSDDSDAFLDDMTVSGLRGMSNTRSGKKRKGPKQSNEKGGEAEEKAKML